MVVGRLNGLIECCLLVCLLYRRILDTVCINGLGCAGINRVLENMVDNKYVLLYLIDNACALSSVLTGLLFQL